MKVFKFGGAALADAAGIQQVASILNQFSDKNLLVVVSAMGKTTNGLEKLVAQCRLRQDYQSVLEELKAYHFQIIHQLLGHHHPVISVIEDLFYEIENDLQVSKDDADVLYDHIVSYGEFISSIVVLHYLKEQKLPVSWVDARDYIQTDNNFREGNVQWDVTTKNIKQLLTTHSSGITITQGFIARTSDGRTITLGRDGSDYTAAIFAASLNAESVSIWKDVPGVMNADPKRLPAATVFEELPFSEAAEMTYYGASVIHPKTIKPLANKGIPLYVKTFIDPALPGTKIHDCRVDRLPPLIVFKDNQCLISCKVTDFTFISEQQLSTIFSALSESNIKINLMQNSAISFSFCIDFRENKALQLIKKLQQHFEVYYNLGLTLITVKNYDEQTFETYRKKPGVLMEQSSRSTLQVLVRNS